MDPWIALLGNVRVFIFETEVVYFFHFQHKHIIKLYLIIAHAFWWYFTNVTTSHLVFESIWPHFQLKTALYTRMLMVSMWEWLPVSSSNQKPWYNIEYEPYSGFDLIQDMMFTWNMRNLVIQIPVYTMTYHLCAVVSWFLSISVSMFCTNKECSETWMRCLHATVSWLVSQYSK